MAERTSEAVVSDSKTYVPPAPVVPLDIDDGSSTALNLDDSGRSSQHQRQQQQRHNNNDDEERHNQGGGLMTSLIGESPSQEEEGEDQAEAEHDGNPDTNNNDNEEEEYITVQQGIERLGAGPFQYKILAASGLCFAADAMQVLLLSFLTLVLKEEWQLSNGQTESITSCLFAGAILGTLILGPAADRVGRRPVFLVSASIISVFGLGTALSNHYGGFMFLLFWVGFGVGGLVVPFDMLAEFLPSKGRGRILLSIEYFWTLGCLFVVVVAYATLHGKPRPSYSTSDADAVGSGHHWRAFVAICTIPCIVSVIFGYFVVPESAMWLAAEGETEKAMNVLRQAAIANGHEDPYVLFPQRLRLRQGESHKDASFAELFTPAWREITLRLWGTWGGFAFGYYGTILVVTRVFEKHESEPQNESSTYDFDYVAIFFSSAAELVGTTLVISLVDKIGRIPAQVGCYLLAGVSVGFLCLQANHGPHFLLVSLGFAARAFEMGATCTTWVSTAEILTTEVRSTGHSTANAMARLGAFFCPFLVEGETPLFRIGLGFFIVHLFTAFCVAKLPETNGREMGAGSSQAFTPVPADDEEGNDDDVIEELVSGDEQTA